MGNETLENTCSHCGHIFFLIIASVFWVPAARAGAAYAYGSPWQPFTAQGLNNCNNETYTLSGKMQFDVRVVTDSAGGLHVTTYVRVRGVGVGSSTGARYIDNEGGNTTENTLSSSQ